MGPHEQGNRPLPGDSPRNISSLYHSECVHLSIRRRTHLLRGLSVAHGNKNAPDLLRSGARQKVEAAGQLAQSFRIGLDYAFIPSSGMRGVLAPRHDGAPSTHSPLVRPVGL